VTRKPDIIVAPSAWTVYVVDDDYQELISHGSLGAAPPLAVLEALVATGRAKRVASIHTYNGIDNDDEPASGIFGEDPSD
jgi:hypothetical protein